MTTTIKSTMTTIILWFGIGLIISVSAQGKTVVQIYPSGYVPVKVGESLRIMCKAPEALRFCQVKLHGEDAVGLSPETPVENGIKYAGEGLIHGECGADIARIRESYNGEFTCTVFTLRTGRGISANLTIVVAKPPDNPIITLTPSGLGRTYMSGDTVEIGCAVRSGRPAANVSLYLGTEQIGRPSFENLNNETVAISKESRKLDWTDHGKIVRCVAEHIALDAPKESSEELHVLFAPQAQENIERFGYVIGRPGIVNVTIYANPRPDFFWHINKETIVAGTPDASNRVETSTPVDLGKGAWRLELKIDSVQKSDTEKEYILEARNKVGTTKYNILLSTSTEPAGADLDAGSIIGIAVGILVLILIVSLIIFARATGRWCFAARRRGDEENAGGAGAGSEAHITPGDEDEDHEDPHIMDEKMPHGGGSSTRNIGESSDTESAGRYSRTEVDGSGRGRRPKITFSQLFKRNKDKVSGADTDTVRTVVTVDDEKVQSTETPVDSQRTNPPSEGGIVYAELDLTQQQQGVGPRRVSDDKTEYAEIVYTKPAEGAETMTPEK